MTTKAQWEQVLQGHDSFTNTVVGFLIEKGWFGDRIVKNIAMKVYSRNRAIVRVLLDSKNQMYYIEGSYVSAGENVLGAYIAQLRASLSPSEIRSAMTDALANVEARIANSFAVRFLGSSAS